MSSHSEKSTKRSFVTKIAQSTPSGSSFRLGRRKTSESSQASDSSPPAPTPVKYNGSYTSQSRVRLVDPQYQLGQGSRDAIASTVDIREDMMEFQETVVQSPEALSPTSPPKQLDERSPLETASTLPSASRTTSPAHTSSGLHWNLLRNAILPSSPMQLRRPLVHDSGVSQLGNPSQSQTPKASRFARLGFRQIAENAREVLRDEMDQFETDVYQAYTSARYGETRHRVDREGSQQSHLPFVSNVSLPLSATSPSGQKSGQPSDSMVRVVPTLKFLHQTLVRYAPFSGTTGAAMPLPYESEILSTLLVPFLVESDLESEERWLGVETFEIIAKTWRPTSQQREVDRILWCCKAALIPPSPVQSRVMGILSNLLFSSTPFQDADPQALQNVMQGLYLLLHACNQLLPGSSGDAQIVREFCARVTSGACGRSDKTRIEQDYGAEWASQDNEQPIHEQIIAEGVLRCMQSGSESLRRWILHESVETYWPLSLGSLSPLCEKIAARRLNTFFRGSLSLLRSDTAQASRHLDSDASLIIYIIQERASIDLEQLPAPKHGNDARVLAIELLLYLLSLTTQHRRQQVIGLICNWSDNISLWMENLETSIRLLIERAEWSHLVTILQGVVEHLPNEHRNGLISIALPALHTRLVVDPPPCPSIGLTSVLRSLADSHPQQFYKPLFGLAGAAKEPTIVGQLGIVTALARYFPEFWIRDSEMLSVALMSDSDISKGKGKEGQPVRWSKSRIGRSLIILELIQCIKALTKAKKDPIVPPDSSQSQAYRFVTGLEARLAVLIEAKEKTSLIPFSQRILLSALFLEIRLFTRSLKPAPWVRRIVTWASQSYSGARLRLQSADDPFSDHYDTAELIVEDADFDEISVTVEKLRSIHIACWQSPPSNSRLRSTVVQSSSDWRSLMGNVEQSNVADAIKEREGLLASLSAGIAHAMLRLLVAVCALLTPADHYALGVVLWSQFLDNTDPVVVAAASFLLNYCLEKSPRDIFKFIENDRSSQPGIIRQNLIRRLVTLFAWRSQLLSQTYIRDRARWKPFKLVQQPIAFVAIDAGSGNYVYEQTEEDRRNLPGGTLPYDLRKRLAEVGWEQNDQPVDTRLEKIRAPMSLFSVTKLDHSDNSYDPPTLFPSQSTESTKLLRSRSSASGHHPGAKRRPVTVPALVSLFSSMAVLTMDTDPIVASDAREAFLVMLRDDPAMLCRPVMDILSSEHAQVGSAVAILRAFLHIHSRLPHPASHHIFSYIGGFLKHLSRDWGDRNTLNAFSYTVPILAKLITQVSSLSVRDLRRSKFEMYVFPSGSLWFPSTAPPSAMFPRSLDRTINLFDELPHQLVAICMIRTAQNILFFDMLKHKPQEVHVLRKNLVGLNLPGESNDKELDARSFLPRRETEMRRHTGYRQLSLTLSRSYLLLLCQIFRSMSRNFNNSAELARLFGGLNKILLAHGNDIGIVTHALIACMTVTTRFKRFVSSSGGFALFMPGLLKVYAEAESHAGIRRAIEYASSRFYAIHEEGFLFQSMEVASTILVELNSAGDKDWFSNKIWQLFSALKGPLHQGTPDAAGIRDCNKAEELDALIATTIVDQAPQTVAQESRRGEQLKKILVTEQYDNKLLRLDDLAKLFLTVIAHDPTIMRAQTFLTLFRYMAPEFYNGSKSARDVLRDGIGALGSALFAKAPRQKAFEGSQERPMQHDRSTPDIFSREFEGGAHLFNDLSSPCNHVTMRREYLSLIVAFLQIGGDLQQEVIRRALELVGGLLKESTRPEPAFEGVFLRNLIESSLSRLSVTAKDAAILLREISPLIRAFALSMDCSTLLDPVTELLKRPDISNDPVFSQLITEYVAGPVIVACGDAGSENLLMSLPIRPSVVSLLCYTSPLAFTDIATIVERQPRSPGFLAGIILPFCLKVKTLEEITTQNQWQTKKYAHRHGLIFVRILAYAMDACRGSAEVETGRSSPLPSLNRRDSERSKHSSLLTNRVPLATLAIVLQVIKIVVIRAADSLSNALPGIWTRLAQFLRELLDDGDGRFALSAGSSFFARPSGPSRSPSPQRPSNAGLTSPSRSRRRTRSTSPDNQFTSSSANSSCTPRIVDYLAWSFMEFLCFVPSPLTLQMRLWMQEKVLNLDAELKAKDGVTGMALGRGSRRLSTSVFAKARGSTVSPDTLRPSHTLSRTPSELNLPAPTSTNLSGSLSRFHTPDPEALRPGWARPRIIHLGPGDQRVFEVPERSFSQDSQLKSLARNENIKSPSLARLTRERIRQVQTFMGYDRLLPLDGNQDDSSATEINFKAWTRVSALVTLADETRLLMDEFSEIFNESPGGDFVDVPPASASVNYS